MRGVLRLRVLAAFVMVVSALTFVPVVHAQALSVVGTNPIRNDMNDTSAVASGWASPGATVSLTVSDGVPADNVGPVPTTAGGDGSWYISGLNLSSMNDGTNNITYTVTSGGTASYVASKGSTALVYITNATNPVSNATKGNVSVSGYAEPNKTVQLTVSDGTPAHDVVYSMTSDPSTGAWLFPGAARTAGLTDGAITYTVVSNGHTAMSPALLDTSTTVSITTWPHPYIYPGNQSPATVSGTAELGDSVSLDVWDSHVPANHVTGSTSVDGSGNWTFSRDLSGLVDGAVTIKASVSDRVLNTANDTKAGITKDTAAPSAPTINAWLHPYINAGNQGAVTISGTAEASSTVNLDISDGTHHVTDSMTATGGNWSFSKSVTGILDDGINNITYSVTATDAATNTGPAATKNNISKDTAAPSAPVISAWTHPYINISNEGAVTLSGTAEASSTVNLDISDGSHHVTDSMTASGGNWSFSEDVTGLLNDGTNNITYSVTATDAAGNTGAAGSKNNISKDTAAPGAPVIVGWTHPYINISNEGAVTISGTAEASSTVNLDISDGSHHVTDSMTATGGNWSFSENVAGLLDDGLNNITYSVTATDASGNTGAAGSKNNISKDTAAPGAPVIVGWIHPFINIGNEGAVTVSGTAEANSTIHLDMSDGSHHVTDTTTADGGGNWSFSENVTGILNDGSGNISYTVTATDASGNTGTAGSKTGISKDTVAPNAPAIVAWLHPYINVSNEGAVTLSGTAEANATIHLDISDGSHHVFDTTSADGSGDWSFSENVTGLLDDGTNNISYSVTATDAAGNTGAPATKSGITKDTTAPSAPVISAYTHPIDALTIFLQNAAISGTAEANAAIHLDITDGTLHITRDTTATGGNWSFSGLDLSSLDEGTNNIHYSVTATDAATNTSSAGTATASKDTLSPTRPAPPTIGTATPGRGAATVTWTPSAFNPGSAITQFTVTAVQDGTKTCIFAGAIGPFTCRVSGLNATPYTFTVTATNGVGTSDPSAPTSPVTPSAPAKPNPPTAVGGTGLDGAALINWTAPLDDGGRPITGYAVTAAAGGVPVPGGTCTTSGPTPGTSCTVSGLSNGVGYTFTVTATNAIGTSDPSTASKTIVPHKGNTYFATTPSRVFDTIALGTPLSANAGITFQVISQFPGDPTRNVPSNASAVTGVLTIVGATYKGFAALVPVVVTPATTSSINFGTGDTISTGVTTPLGPGGTLGLTYGAPDGNTANAYLDVTGYFVAGTSGSTYVTISPTRILDTRPTGSGHTNTGLVGKFDNGVPRTFQVTGRGGVPTWATAVTGNVTLTNQSTAGHVTVGPDPEASPATTTIYSPSWPATKDNRATAITIKLGTGGTLSATWTGAAASTADLIFDVNGYFVTGLSGAMYVPLTPNRILSTRDKIGLSRNLIAYHGVTFTVINRFTSDPTKNVPSTAVAVTGTLTVTRQQMLGFLTLTPTAQNHPTTSTLNFLMENRATGVTVPLGAGKLGICYGAGTNKTTDAIFDVTGYFMP